MAKELKEKLEQDEQIIEVAKSKEETLEAFIEEAAPVVETTKKRKSNASVSIDKFDWDAFEKENVYDERKM